MADDEIDVEGEFDLKTELGEEFYDANELPSKSANLLPEFTSPAWMLEQGWSLDSCMDEKSKATIEKMLLEEQQYMYGRKTSRYLSIKKNVLLVTAGTSKTVTPNKSPWSQEEKNTFLRGMGIFGRSWSKIASLIPTRTSLQVKNYAQQYMKNLAKKKAEIERTELETLKCMSETPLYTPSQTPSSLAATVASVTTGQPTIPVASTSVSKSRTQTSSSTLTSKTSAVPSTTASSSAIKFSHKYKTSKKKKDSLSKLPDKKTSKGKRPSKKSLKDKSATHRTADSSHHTIIAYSDVSETAAGASQEADLITVSTNRARNIQGTTANVTKSNSMSKTQSFKIDDMKETQSSDEDEIDVEVDIENDDEENLVLQSRSTSPSSVYKHLLKSADIDILEKGSLNADLIRTAASSLAEMQPDEGIDKGSHIISQNESIMNGENKEEKLDNHTQCSKNHVSSDSRSVSPMDTLQSFRGEEEEEEQEHHVKTDSIVNGLIAASGEIIEFEIPSEEKVLVSTSISDEEKKIHADFFDGRAPKTPERYLKIRNYIIDCWLKSKPAYLNKTSIRAGLKNCGDVNCIGRIHSYLECVGAINICCEQAAYRNPNKILGGGTNSRVKSLNKDLISSVSVKFESTRPRKRRIRDGTGLWVDEKELEGKTIDHNSEKKKLDASKRSKTPRAVKPVYDPFKLVPCLPFSDGNLAPYEIEMFSTALAIMDIHAHISKTEVIGMLGGQFSAEAHRLTVSMAVPCKSMSTGMQCEMDPVSQTLASEQIEDVGMQVVGWYHSHPTFSPDPSVRDIETQQKFQYWFSKGGNHFVGVIISPYNSLNPSVNSDIRCLTISDLHSKEFLCNIPYKFAYDIVYRDNLREILGPASELAEKYSNYVNRVMLSCQYRASLGITCLSKMLQSVKRLLVPEMKDNSLSSAGPETQPLSSLVSLTTTVAPLKSVFLKLQNKPDKEKPARSTQEMTNVCVQPSGNHCEKNGIPTSPGDEVKEACIMPQLSSRVENGYSSNTCKTSCLTVDTLMICSSPPSSKTNTITTSASSSSPAADCPSLLSSSSGLMSKSKVDEVLHWLEQIFLEKFSQSTPRSPPIGSLSSLERAKPCSLQENL
ncbi:histone h2a deubiquitinase mysm1-like [Plakobranchus ocellatus]|uniref:Myb-like, SWIRM and MPN domain-containing protein 1 n=1 Tax=Plakobranchus ocellatus TaxID=259542 RepID=A0AAV4DV02_9GAST|nr:histone h2a deubiquitinase mysm1-like [Plakobranchus ocellatus]